MKQQQHNLEFKPVTPIGLYNNFYLCWTEAKEAGVNMGVTACYKQKGTTWAPGVNGILPSELSNTSQGRSPWADPSYYGLFGSNGITWPSRSQCRAGEVGRISQDVVCLLPSCWRELLGKTVLLSIMSILILITREAILWAKPKNIKKTNKSNLKNSNTES